MSGDPRLQISGAPSYSEITDQDFAGSDLASVAPRQIRFRRCSFRAADLRQATLTGCDLREADLRDCDLTGAVVTYQRTGDETGRTDVTGAMPAGADLTGVTADRVIGWPEDQNGV